MLRDVSLLERLSTARARKLLSLVALTQAAVGIQAAQVVGDTARDGGVNRVSAGMVRDRGTKTARTSKGLLVPPTVVTTTTATLPPISLVLPPSDKALFDPSVITEVLACIRGGGKYPNNESNGDYRITSKNGLYHGAYQFLISTWDGVAKVFAPQLVGVHPAKASTQEQDFMATALLRRINGNEDAFLGQWPRRGACYRMWMDMARALDARGRKQSAFSATTHGLAIA